MRLVALRAPLKLLGTERHRVSSSANKNDRGPAATGFFLSIKLFS